VDLHATSPDRRLAHARCAARFGRALDAKLCAARSIETDFATLAANALRAARTQKKRSQPPPARKSLESPRLRT